MDDISRRSPPPSTPNDSIPSSPLSMRSRSPTPPFDYPSPVKSRSPSNEPEMGRYGPPPPKRRKTNPASDSNTKYLDLSSTTDHSREDDIQLQRLMQALRKKKKIVVIAGAGISVSAGIPDFRSSNGLFKSLRSQHNLKSSGQDLFDASVYKNDSTTASFHDMVREMSQLTRAATPTAFHHMLASLAAEGRLLRLYSQNVDGIDTRLQPLATTIPLNGKAPWPKTIQLHGGLDKMVCSKCGDLAEFDADLFEGTETPPCKACEGMDEARAVCGKRSHGIGRLRPRMVLYNEYNPDQDAIGAVTTADLRSRPDAVIVVGTSLKIPGVRRIASEMCKVVKGRKDGFTAWINYDPEPAGPEFADCWDLVVYGACDEVARQVALPLWNDEIGEFKDMTGETIERKEFSVEVGGRREEVAHKKVVKVKGMVTPTASPRGPSPMPVRDGKKMRQPKLFAIRKKAVRTGSDTDDLTKATVKKDSTRNLVKISENTVSVPPKATAAKQKPAAARKKLPTKPRTALPTKPTSRITSAFTSTKSTTASTQKDKPAKHISVYVPLIPTTTAKTSYPPILPPSKSGSNAKENSTVGQGPMEPISSREARNNSSSSSYPVVETFSPPRKFAGLAGVGKTPNTAIVVDGGSPDSQKESPGEQLKRERREREGRKKRKKEREETISPGAVPRGMERLLS